MSTTELAPGLLLSMPQLMGPCFERAVIVMLEHNEDGSLGLIANQRSEASLPELLATLDIPWHGPVDANIWSGGPVMPESGWVLHSHGSSLSSDSSATRVCEDLFVSTSEDDLRALAANPPERLRFLLGYAGWGPGQLMQEIAQGSWLFAPIDTKLLFDTPCEAMWEQSLHSLGIHPESLVQCRGVH